MSAWPLAIVAIAVLRGHWPHGTRSQAEAETFSSSKNKSAAWRRDSLVAVVGSFAASAVSDNDWI